MNDIASELGMDPFELRRKNLFRDGDQLIQSQVLHDVLVAECMNRALELAGYPERAAALPPNHGIGIANITKTSGLLASSAIVKVNEDATVSLVTSAVDIGTGTHTMLLQIAAETLGIPLDRISIAALDSDSGPFDIGSIASRTVVNTGNAVRLACEDLRTKLIQVAADMLKCGLEDLFYVDGRAYRSDDPEAGFDFATLVSIATYAHKGPVTGTGSYNGDRPFEISPGEGFPETMLPAVGYGTHLAEVAVDPETGQVEVLNYVAVHDVGQAINPQGVEAQIEGGVVQGAGFGMLEESILEDGVVQNPTMATYLLPTALDVPPITTCMLGTGTADGPFGAKGIGEHVMVAAAPAIANAIHAATGVVVRDLPITAEKLYRALQQKPADGDSDLMVNEDRE